MQYILVYVTAADRAEAERIAAAVVGERLAACANIFGSMRSLYWWEGRVEQGDEAVLLLKSELNLFEALRERVRALHSYATPCIVALPILAGHREYLDWIGASINRTGA